ncbi:MAG: S-layer homology domain-containing protein, partial [Moorella sp. (in: Bacteria)]|nr:S-layer homology domain-containing protein [Moorella sp. (in: firmicutes)]
AIPPLVRPENLVLAWYDKASGQWQVIPAVVDLSKGLILARLKHFSDFAVFAREERKSFADVTPGSFGWARDTIETLAGAGIVAGVDGTRFEPGRPVTRAEFASLLVKALHLQGKADATIPFKDVKKGDWFSEAVAAAAEAGLVKGYVDNTFRPEKSITREEAAAVLVRTLNLPATTEQQIAFQDQAKVSSWARTSVAAAAAHGLVKGFPDGTFRPAATATRAECAALIYRLLAIE